MSCVRLVYALLFDVGWIWALVHLVLFNHPITPNDRNLPSSWNSTTSTFGGIKISLIPPPPQTFQGIKTMQTTRRQQNLRRSCLHFALTLTFIVSLWCLSRFCRHALTTPRRVYYLLISLPVHPSAIQVATTTNSPAHSSTGVHLQAPLCLSSVISPLCHWNSCKKYGYTLDHQGVEWFWRWGEVR